MLVLGALCVLLPLVASLETCNPSIVEGFLAEDQLEGNLLDNVCPTMNMLVLGTLCALLLPLATSLDNCDMTKAANCLAGRHLQGDLLKYFAEKKWWMPAVSTAGAGSSQSVEITFGRVTDGVLPVQLVYRNRTGDIYLDVTGSYTLEGDHLLTNKRSVYLFQCSEHLTAGYRCLNEGTAAGTGGSGSDYFVWAAWDTTEAVVSAELDSCLTKITTGDASATFVQRSHP